MSISVELNMDDPQGWRAMVPLPFYTTRGLWFWQRWNEDNWRPQCTHCAQMPIFDTRLEYDRHYAIMHFPWPHSFEQQGWQKFVATK